MAETENTALLFLHLSDIHCADHHGARVFDLDSDLRRAINDDAATLREQLGPFSGILITGDVAFAAGDNEYKNASGWLDELQGIVGSLPKHTYTVPGNHDIDRVAATAPAIAAFQSDLRNCELNRIDSKLESWLSDSNPDNELPYRPLSSYNAFAKRYGCDLQPGKTFWDTTIPLAYGCTLGIRGFTSVFCSNRDDDTGNNKLVVGLAQALMPIERGRANLSLCHHPPDWLRRRRLAGEELIGDGAEREDVELLTSCPAVRHRLGSHVDPGGLLDEYFQVAGFRRPGPRRAGFEPLSSCRQPIAYMPGVAVTPSSGRNVIQYEAGLAPRFETTIR